MSQRRQELAASLREVQERIQRAVDSAGRDRAEITLIVVTKTFPASDAEILYELGARNFGENRDEEGREKSQILPNDSIWHFQGQIQSKKLRSITEWANVIHSLDELAHARKIATLSAGKAHSVFVQVSLDSPNTQTGRGGVGPALLMDFLRECSMISELDLRGLMAVAPLNMDPVIAFSRLAQLRKEVIAEFPQVASLSCGMSGDFEAAIAAGATHIRIGSSILGSR